MNKHSGTLTEHTQLIADVAALIRTQFRDESSGHDWWHIWRVWRLSRLIARHEGGDQLVIELAALLHETMDWKFNDGDWQVSGRQAAECMASYGLSTEIISSVRDIILHMPFKGAGVADAQLPLEGCIVQDADRLDAIGAIGVARTFTFGGAKGAPIFLPDVAPSPRSSFAEYKTGSVHTINHFYEKLLLLKDRMNTKYAQELARRRHEFMEQFLDQFSTEWGECSALPDLDGVVDLGQ